MSTAAHPLSQRSATPAHPAWLPREVWPWDTKVVVADGTDVAVTDVGEGPVLLFVHTGYWSFLWRDLISRLAGDFRCVTLDAPGSGLSGRPDRRRATLEAASRAVEAVIEQLSLDDITLVVHDLGGPVGLAAAARWPDRIRGIVSMSSFAWRPSGAFFRGMLALMGSAPIRELDTLSGALVRITSTSFGVGRRLDRQSRRAFRSGVDRSAARTFHRYMRDARTADGLYARADAATSSLRDRPLLTVFGKHYDPLGFQPRWKELFSRTQQIVVPKGHHFPMCDAPDLVADSIRSWHRAQPVTISG